MNLLQMLKLPIFLQGGLNTDSIRQAMDNIEGETVTEETISIWQLILDGGWYIMGPLALLSVTAVYIFIERTLAINRASKEDKDFMNKIRDYVHEGKVDSAKNLCHTINTPIARIISKGVSRMPVNWRYTNWRRGSPPWQRSRVLHQCLDSSVRLSE